jgi:hypothetical protein
MAIIACARRKSDGLLTWAQVSPQAPNQNAIIQKGIDKFGGVAGDWEYTELTAAEYTTVQDAMPGRSFYIPQGEPLPPLITTNSAPSLTSDKAQIEDDGVDEATITFDALDAAYTGDVDFIVSAPDGTMNTVVKTAVAGVATLSLTTLLTGAIAIDARAEAKGDSVLIVEGI